MQDTPKSKIDISAKIKNYRSVGEEPAGFDQIKPINLIIGKNNSGKSSLIDLIQGMTDQGLKITANQYHKGKISTIEIGTAIKKVVAQNAYSRPKSTRGIPNVQVFIDELSGCKIFYSLNPVNQSKNYLRVEGIDVPKGSEADMQKIVDKTQHPFQNKLFQKISSERNINPEPLKIESSSCDEFGNGATNLINRFLNHTDLNENIITNEFLDALNSIFNPDYKFEDIKCQTDGNSSEWEIFLVHKGSRISLSNSGSGLKTIILVLINLLLVPVANGKEIKHYVFAFEELENNLHPSLFRNLLTYIDGISRQTETNIFITTHSHVAIDLFARLEHAQIIHTKHENSITSSKLAMNYQDSTRILEDLEIKASDLLQSNSIVWVEGPSDRIYINKWISLMSDDIYEGAHYQIMFYGGRLSSHLSIEDPEMIEELISVLKINRNSFIVMDSDKRNEGHELNDTKKRLINEASDIGANVWVTEGREIENYLTKETLKKTYDIDLKRRINKYQSIKSYLNKCSKKLGDRYVSNKYYNSIEISKNMNYGDIESNRDLELRLRSLIEFIKGKNYLTNSQNGISS